MNNLDEDESCLSSSSSLVENEVIAINGKLKSNPLSDHCVRIKLEDPNIADGVNHSLISSLGLVTSANQQTFSHNPHLTLSSGFLTDNHTNNTLGNLNQPLINSNNNTSNNNINSNNNRSNNPNTNHINHHNNNNIPSNNTNNNNTNLNNSSVINQSNGQLNVQYINVSYNPSSGLSTVNSSPTVSTLVSSSSTISLTSSTTTTTQTSLALSSTFKHESPILHPSAIKLEPLDIGIGLGSNGRDKGVFNSIKTSTVTTSSNSLGSGMKLESSLSLDNGKDPSSHLNDCFLPCPAIDDLVNPTPIKSNLSLAHHHHPSSTHNHLTSNSISSSNHSGHHQSHSHNHSTNHHNHHHSHHQRVLISPTDFLSLPEETLSLVSAVKKDVNLSTSRLEIIKKSNDTHGLTVSLDRYCESPFLIDSHREIHLISDDDTSNTGRASRLSETHEDIQTEDLFAATLADDQHNAIREVVVTPIESETNCCATPITLIPVNPSDKSFPSTSPLPSPITCSSPSLSSSALSSGSSSISSSSSLSLNCSTSLLTTSAVTDDLSTVTVSSSSMANGFNLALVKEEKFDEDEGIEQMIVEDGTVDNDHNLVNGIVDDEVDLLTSRSAATSTVKTFSVLNTLHNNGTVSSHSPMVNLAPIISSPTSNSTAIPATITSTKSSTLSTTATIAPSSSSSNVTLPLTPLDIKILPGGLLQFAANVAAVFPSSTILQKQLALQLLREDGTSIILPLTTRNNDSTGATIASGFNAINATSGASGLGVSSAGQTNLINLHNAINSNNFKGSTPVTLLGNAGTLIGNRTGGIMMTNSLGLGTGPATGAVGASASLTETLIPTLSTSQISLTSERFEQQSQTQLLHQQSQQSIVVGTTTTTRDSINSTKLLTSENSGQTTEIDRPFKCELCNSTFTRLGNYTRHKKIHSLPSKEDQRFRCDICGKSFIQRCDLARHLHIHRGTEPHRCSQCGKGYIRHSDLVTHQRFHNKEKPFACPHCSKGFCQRGDLNRHLRSIHLQLKPILCSHCHKKFAKEETLLRHINANHRDTVVT